MIVRRYEKSDFPQIAKWGKDHGSRYDESQFPPTGFIVDGYAAYFLYKTDSAVCFLENLISNPHADKRKKSKAIELVILAILKEAADSKFKVAHATTDSVAVIGRAFMHGAKAKFNHTLLTKNLDPSQ